MNERADLSNPEYCDGVTDYLFSREKLTQLFKNNDEISFGNKAWQGLVEIEGSPIIDASGRERLSIKKLSEFLQRVYSSRVSPKIPGMGYASWYSLNLIEDHFVSKSEGLPEPEVPCTDPEFDGQLVFLPEDLASFSKAMGIDMDVDKAYRIQDIIAKNVMDRRRVLCRILPKGQRYRIDGAYLTIDNSEWRTILEKSSKVTLGEVNNLFYNVGTFNPSREGSIPYRHHYVLAKYLRSLKLQGIDLGKEQYFMPSHPCLDEGFRPVPAVKEDIKSDIIPEIRRTLSGACELYSQAEVFFPLTGLFYEVEERDGKRCYLSKQRLQKFLANVIPDYSYDGTLINKNTMQMLIVADAKFGEGEELPEADISSSEGMMVFNPNDLQEFAAKLGEEIDMKPLLDLIKKRAISGLASKYVPESEKRNLSLGLHEYEDMRYFVKPNGDIMICDVSLEYASKNLLYDISRSNLKDAYIFCRYFKALRQQGVRIKL